MQNNGNKFDGFIFDIDGTITATNELIFETFRHVSKKYLNKHVSDEEIISLFGPTEDYILQNWMKERYHEARVDYFDFYKSNHAEMAAAYEGIVDLIKEIKSNDKLLSIYTGKGRDSSLITLEEVDALKYFDMIVTGDDVENHKPSPEGILVFLEKYNLSKDKVLMIGDAPADIKAARDAGVKVASVLWDSYAKDQVLQMKSDFYFETVDELRDFVRGSF